MPGCGALHCKNRSEKGFKLYALPTGNRNKERRQLWTKYIGRDPLPEKTFICEEHFTSDQFELNRADGKKKLKWNAVPRVFMEKKEYKENIVNPSYGESNKNSQPDPELFLNSTKKSSSLLQENRCGIFEQVDVVDHPKLKEEIFITSEEEEELEIIKCASQNYMRSRNGVCETNFGEQQARPFDLTEVCRICFGKTQLENVFTATYQECTLHNLLEFCSSVKINKNTKFKLICVRCKNQLIENYMFIRKVITSNDSLQSVELNNKKSSRLKTAADVEEIFIFVDKNNKSTEVSEQNLSNSLIKFGENVTDEKSASETNSFEKLTPLQNQHIFEKNNSVNGKNNISEYYLIKADGNMMQNFFRSKSIFRIPKKEVTKILPNLTDDINDSTKNVTINTELDCVSGKLRASATPVQKVVHLQDHTYVEEYAEELSSSDNKISFLCEKCGISLSSVTNLKNHRKRIHEGIKSSYSRCRKCNVLFRSQASYETHRSQHIGKHHCCETCGKMFAGMAHLRQHLRRHSTLRPFTCGVCSKNFRAKYLLNYHVARHLKEKRHVCPVCNGTFIKISDLRSHVNKIHPGKLRSKPFTCDKCNYKCFKNRTLLIHLKKAHNLVIKEPNVAVTA